MLRGDAWDAQARRLPQIKHLSARINRGVRDRSLTKAEARDLREKLIALEVDDARDLGYRVKQPKARGAPAPTDPKAFDLDKRFAALAADIKAPPRSRPRTRTVDGMTTRLAATATSAEGQKATGFTERTLNCLRRSSPSFSQSRSSPDDQ